MKDYYSILNLDRTANTKEIRKAYYKLARENHPDVNNALNAHEKFIEINEAYQVLKNLTHRRNYNFLYDSRKNKTNYKSRKSRKKRESTVNKHSNKGRAKGYKYASQSEVEFEKRAKKRSSFNFPDVILEFILEFVFWLIA